MTPQECLAEAERLLDVARRMGLDTENTIRLASTYVQLAAVKTSMEIIDRSGA